MSVRSGQVITKEFRTRNPTTLALADADSTPAGTLYVNGVADAATVTITHHSTGRYHATVTLPTLAVGDIVELEIAATVGGVSDADIVWSDSKDIAVSAAGIVDADCTPGDGPGPYDDSVLAAAAAGPLEVETDAGRVKQHRPTDLIEVDKYLASKTAGTDPKKTLRFNQLIRRDAR